MTLIYMVLQYMDKFAEMEHGAATNFDLDTGHNIPAFALLIVSVKSCYETGETNAVRGETDWPPG
jgi:hypothetical protein